MGIVRLGSRIHFGGLIMKLEISELQARLLSQCIEHSIVVLGKSIEENPALSKAITELSLIQHDIIKGMKGENHDY